MLNGEGALSLIDLSDTALSNLPLTDPAAFVQRNIAVPEELRPFIATFHEFSCNVERVVDMHPCYASHLLINLQGDGFFAFPSGHRDRLAPSSLLAPCSCATRYFVDGGFQTIGAALTPLGWAALTGLDAHDDGNRVFPAADRLGPAAEILAHEARMAWNDGCTGEVIAEKLRLFIQARLRDLVPAHMQFISLMRDWLSKGQDWDLAALPEKIGYSDRQIQRLSKRYFGLPPQMLLRKTKALKAAVVLSDPDATDIQLARVADYYYDQSHMIREIRHFVGRTPGALRDLRSPVLNKRLRQ